MQKNDDDDDDEDLVLLLHHPTHALTHTQQQMFLTTTLHCLLDRLDSDELKQLLKRHSNVFTDREIVELGELYYAAKAGDGVKFHNFIEAIDRVAQKAHKREAVAMAASSSSSDDSIMPALHFREGGSQHHHPLGIVRDGVEFYNLGHPHGHYTEKELNIELTHVEPKDLVDKMAYQAVRMVRVVFDSVTGWKNDPSQITATNVLYRVIYLETIAAVPGKDDIDDDDVCSKTTNQHQTPFIRCISSFWSDNTIRHGGCHCSSFPQFTQHESRWRVLATLFGRGQ